MSGWSVLCSVVMAFAACNPSRAEKVDASAPAHPRSSDPNSEHYEGPALPTAKVVLKDAYGGSHTVEVEVAADGAARSRGLMWRKSLEAGKGMLFMFPYEQVQSFWMRNTLIPLDMVFISQERKVVGIVENAEPHTETSRKVAGRSLYVLEVPGGWTGSQGIKSDAAVEFQGLAGILVRH